MAILRGIKNSDSKRLCKGDLKETFKGTKKSILRKIFKAILRSLGPGELRKISSRLKMAISNLKRGDLRKP